MWVSYIYIWLHSLFIDFEEEYCDMWYKHIYNYKFITNTCSELRLWSLVVFLIFKNGLDISPLEIRQECLHVLHVEGFTLTLSPYNVSSISLHTWTILGFFFFSFSWGFWQVLNLLVHQWKCYLLRDLLCILLIDFPMEMIRATPLSQRRKEIFWMGTQKPAAGIHDPVLYLDKKSKTVQCFPTQHDSCVFLSPNFVHLWVSGKDLFKVGTFKLKEVMSYLNNGNKW